MTVILTPGSIEQQRNNIDVEFLCAIHKIDTMSFTIERVDWDVLQVITDRILVWVENVNRVCYDMSPRLPTMIVFDKRIIWVNMEGAKLTKVLFFL